MNIAPPPQLSTLATPVFNHDPLSSNIAEKKAIPA